MTTFMAQEIAEIPAAALRLLRDGAPQRRAAAAALRELDPDMLLTIARGSSDNAATYLKYAVELSVGIPVASVGPSVASVYGRSLRLGRAAVIGISQSGRSPDIVEMMRSAGASGATSIAITNTADSPMAAIANHTLALHAGEERSVAATKTFILSALAGLALLAEWIDDPALRNAVESAPDAFGSALTLDWTVLADRLVNARSAYVLGRGTGYAIAQEAALKLKETCGIHAEAHSAAEVLHGPSAIVSQGFPVLALSVDDAARDGLVRTSARLSAQGADVFLTGAAAQGCVTLPSLSGQHPLLAPLVLAVAFYGFVEGLSRRRGYNPDTPPNLRKITETQ